MEETFEFERDGRKFIVEAKRYFNEWLGEFKVTADIFEAVTPEIVKFRAHVDCEDGDLSELASGAVEGFLWEKKAPIVKKAITFEELISKVREAKNLHRVVCDASVTYMRESFADEKFAFGWVVKHAAKGFEDESRRIVLTCGELMGDRLQMIEATPEQLLQFREALCLKVEFDGEDEAE